MSDVPLSSARTAPPDVEAGSTKRESVFFDADKEKEKGKGAAADV